MDTSSLHAPLHRISHGTTNALAAWLTTSLELSPERSFQISHGWTVRFHNPDRNNDGRRIDNHKKADADKRRAGCSLDRETTSDRSALCGRLEYPALRASSGRAKCPMNLCAQPVSSFLVWLTDAWSGYKLRTLSRNSYSSQGLNPLTSEDRLMKCACTLLEISVGEEIYE